MAKVPFLKPFTRERHQQDFDRKKIFFVQKGKKINIYDYIQESREDTEIIPCLRKYGNLKPLEVDHQLLYGEFEKMHDLRDIYDIKNKADELWDQLPAELKGQFNNSQQEFLNKAPKWLDEKIKTMTIQTGQPEGQPEEQPEGADK